MLVIHRLMFENVPHLTDQHCWCDPTYIEETIKIDFESEDGDTADCTVTKSERTDLIVDDTGIITGSLH